MNIHELNYVLCIARHQNMTKAAQELFISQPTLSKHLGKLERELGIKLFSRVDNCYIPTYAGRRYMEYASGVLELTRDWEKELADLRSQNDGELNVAFPLMRSSCMIPRILPAFRRIHPNIRLNFLEETYAIQERLLTDSRIDFAIFSDGSLNPKLEYETLGHEEILLAVSPDHPLARKVRPAACKDSPYPQVDLSELGNEKFILHFPEQNTGAITEQLLKKYGIKPKVPFYTRNTQAALLLVQQNEGICFAPETYIQNMTFRTPPVCFSLHDPDAFTSTIIAYRKGAYLTSYALDFIQISKDYFGGHLNKQ
ncbi:LysR family transcriptional regulator [Blautia sp.]|uniref:LysR family transcriptional regulator n=1 Tax=Blautia sp. TaxID=1955243 RepID=UPI0025878D5E|nr:LysR family transcriptional regulator [Blautia sp.]